MVAECLTALARSTTVEKGAERGAVRVEPKGRGVGEEEEMEVEVEVKVKVDRTKEKKEVLVNHQW